MISKAIKWDGKNGCDVCCFITGADLAPYELAGGFWLKQIWHDDRAPDFRMVWPAVNGVVEMAPGDWAAYDTVVNGWVRLSDAQYRAEVAAA